MLSTYDQIVYNCINMHGSNNSKATKAGVIVRTELTMTIHRIEY